MPVVRRLVLALLLIPSAAHANTWTGIGSDWFAPFSWSALSPPTATQEAILDDNYNGFTLAVTDVQLSASTTIGSLSVDSPTTKQYTFTGANGAVLNANLAMSFHNSDLQALNVHTITNLGLNTPSVYVNDNAVLSLNNATVTTNAILVRSDGRVDVNNGSSVQTLRYFLEGPAGELRVNSGGELRIAGDTTLFRGTTTVNIGGQLNALSGVDLEYNGTALLQFADSHTVDDGVHLKATGGGDITAGSFIDVGNSAVGSLTVTGAGSTFTAAGSIRSDWGSGSGGNATVTISNSGVANVSSLVAGFSNGAFVGNVTSGGVLRTTSTFRMGGGTTIRTVSLTVGGGTLETAGLATFDNQANLNLTSGTINFNGGATFNAGSRFDWSGGFANLGAGQTLLVDGGVVNRTSTSGFSFGGNSTTQIRNGGTFTTPSFFDLETATLDMTGGILTVGTTNGIVSDWGRNSGVTTTATITTNAVATYRSGLRMSQVGGTTSATVSSGARLAANGFLETGGAATSNVTLNVTGGRVDSDGSVSFLRGTTTTVSSAGVVEGQDVVLGSSGGITSTTVTGASSLLKARGTLTSGRAGTSSLTISAGGKAESVGQTIIGELAGASSTVTVMGAGSKLTVGGGLTVGGAGGGTLQFLNGGLATVTGSVFVNSSSSIFLGDASRMELPVGQAITHEGELDLVGDPTLAAELDADVVNDGGVLRIRDANANRGVTMLADAEMFVENATVGSLNQVGGNVNFGLRSALDFDDLLVFDTATFGPNATFVISLAGGFSPTLGMTFPIFTADSISGTPNFDFSAAILPSGLGWVIALGPTISLAVVPSGITGDYNANGVVDAADYVVWRKTDGTQQGYDIWRSHFGQSNTGSGASVSTTVPEPATLAMLLGGILAAYVRRRALVS